MTAKSTFRPDFSGEKRDLTSKLLELVDHGVDCALEKSDFRVHLFGMDQNFFAQIAHSDSRDDGTNFPQCFLESQVGWGGQSVVSPCTGYVAYLVGVCRVRVSVRQYLQFRVRIPCSVLLVACSPPDSGCLRSVSVAPMRGNDS